MYFLLYVEFVRFSNQNYRGYGWLLSLRLADSKFCSSLNSEKIIYWNVLKSENHQNGYANHWIIYITLFFSFLFLCPYLGIAKKAIWLEFSAAHTKITLQEEVSIILMEIHLQNKICSLHLWSQLHAHQTIWRSYH